MNTLLRLPRNLLLASLLVVAAGCGGSDRAAVQGRITRHDGTPLAGATVTARSDETGKWAKGVTDADGKYELGVVNAGDGIPPGDYYVTVVEDRGDQGQLPATIPAKYGKSTSGLTLTLSAGDAKEFNVTLDAS